MSEEEIFHEALARGSPAERAAYLEQACARKAWERGKLCNAETFRRDPAGNQPRPAELGQQPEASLAWCRGDPGCEAETASERAVPLSPEISLIAGADVLFATEGRAAAPQRPGACGPAGV